MSRQRISVAGSGMVGDYKFSLLSETQFQLLNGDGWVVAKGQEIIGSKFSELTGINRLPDGRGMFVRSVISIANRTFQQSDVNINNETITISNHEYSTGMRVGISTTGTIPAGLNADTRLNSLSQTIDWFYYYVIVVDANTIKLASSRANAFAGTAINITSQGVGVHTIKQKVDPSNRFDQQSGSNNSNAGSYQEDAMRRMFDIYDAGFPTSNDTFWDAGLAGGGVDGGGNAIRSGYIDNSRGHLTSSENRPQNISGYLYIKIN